MDDNRMKIHLLVDNQRYPMTILREEEGLWREAAKQINDMLNTVRNGYRELTPSQHWAMVAILLSHKEIASRDRNDTQPIHDKLKELTDELDKYIKEE